MKNVERDNEIVGQARTGKTLQEISVQYGLSREGIRKILIKNNADMPKDARQQTKKSMQESDNHKNRLVQNWVLTHMGCTIVELSLGTGLTQKECAQHLPKGTKHLILNPSDAPNSNTWTTDNLKN